MPPPDYPRLPPSYSLDPSRLRSTSISVGLPAQDELAIEGAIRAAAALTLAAHAGEQRYVVAVQGSDVVEGELDDEGEVGTLLDAVKPGMERAADAGNEARLTVRYSAGGSAEDAGVPKTPLLLDASTSDNSLTLTLSYDSTLLPALEAEWFLSHVAHAVPQLLALPPSTPLSTVSLSPPSEASTLSRYASSDPPSAPSAAYPAWVKTLPDFFLHAAREYPEAEAVFFLPSPDSPTPQAGAISLTFSQTLYLAQFLAARLLPSLRALPEPAQTKWREGNIVLPVCLSKSPLLPLALLTISLTGCGYLALEPSFPEDRKKGILEELQAEGMLAPCGVVESLDHEQERWGSWGLLSSVLEPGAILAPLVEAAAAGASVPELEKRFPLSTEVEWPQIREDGLAYVIYTSGSTGKPKGVMVEHRQVAAFLRNYRNVFGRAPGERVLQFPSYAFDVSVMNIWDCWAHGSTLCLAPPSSLYSSLSATILALNCTLVDLTPTVSSLLFEHPDAVPHEGETVKAAWERAGFRIKQVNTGGERVEKAVRERWRERGVRVVVDYGPTETTVGVISNRSLAVSPSSPYSLPIGHPTGNTRIAVLSVPSPTSSPSSPSSLRPVPLGCIGELCVLGPQLTRGYVLPKLNEGVFCTLDQDVPGVGEKGERVYRTGDLGRWVVADWEEEGETEGWVECLGRRDGQVKVNGLRIEIGEIEEHLTSLAHPSLTRGIVDKFEPPSGGAPSLIAYLELSASAFPLSPSLVSGPAAIHPASTSPPFQEVVDAAKTHLAQKLPQYMVPRFWVAVTRVPTQGMGKADRKTLKALADKFDFRAAARSSRRNDDGAEGEHKRTVTKDEHHEAARRAWAEVLRMGKDDSEKIADQDEFMKLGGDSIRFMKLVSLLRSSSSSYAALRFADIVDAATLSACAAALSRAAAASSASSSDAPQGEYEPFSLLPSSSREQLHAELASHSPALPPSRLADAYPTAPSQDALLAPSFDSPIGHYYAQAVYTVAPSAEELSVEKLQESVRQMIAREEALRTVFVLSEAEGALACVLSEVDGEVKERSEIVRIEVSGGEQQMHEAVSTWLKEDRARFSPFAWGKLHLSFALFEGKNGARKLGWGMHHAMSDGWTLELLTSDLRSLCFGLPLRSRPAFSSVASWWRTPPPAEREKATLDFWRSYLNGAGPLAWPSQDKLGDEMLATTGAAILHWSGELDSLTARHGITPAIASRLAIAIALSHHAAKEDVVLGIVRSGRDIDVSDADEIIGPCVSVLPSRVLLSSAAVDSLPSLLSLARAEASSDRLARVHQRVTLPSLSRACDLSARNDLFSILVTFQSLAERDPAFDAAAPWPVRQPPERIHMPTNYALSFEVTPQLGKKDDLELACFFDERIIEKSEVDEVLKSVARVLDFLVAAPCTTVEEVKTKLGGGVSSAAEGGGAAGKKIEEPVASDGAGKGVLSPEAAELVKRLRAEWAAVLRLDEGDFGAEETFSSLGGDSIAAMRLAVRLQRTGLAIPTQQLAKLPTLRRQAEWLVASSFRCGPSHCSLTLHSDTVEQYQWKIVLRRGAEEVNRREDGRREQLMARAKVVRLEGEDAATEEDIEEALVTYDDILASSQRVTAVELDDVPAEALPRAIAAISSSPSRTCMSSLFIRGAVLGLDGAVHTSETTLIDFLHSLPALTSLALHLWGFPPVSPVVSSPVAVLPVHSFDMGTQGHQWPTTASPPGSPYYALTRLTIRDRHFQGIRTREEAAVLTTFLAAIPPSLASLALDFACPFDFPFQRFIRRDTTLRRIAYRSEDGKVRVVEWDEQAQGRRQGRSGKAVMA
ncbi:hypothetical protein JCM10213_001518 [Rhodosporidiobolus nylandii]